MEEEGALVRVLVREREKKVEREEEGRGFNRRAGSLNLKSGGEMERHAMRPEVTSAGG